MSDLKPCPFCGGTNIDPEEVMAQRKDGTRYSYPGCGDCGASCETWNDRTETAEVKDLKEVEAAAVEAFYLNGYHGGGCMCANCLLKLILDRHSTVLKQDRETVKRMGAADSR